MRNFASRAGKSSGEFYTPVEVGFLMAEVLQPQAGMSICDWASGSGGLLLQCIRHVKKHGGELRQLRLYGQESNGTTYNIIPHQHDPARHPRLGPQTGRQPARPAPPARGTPH
ncbi:MAG TPA: N-6 DNA methylase [Lamprocystis sp. (in: g-proteobacteria)]|nr:N-6 DNA methylase [Lamprocystis sp. (in: g-proteobacteria)]